MKIGAPQPCGDASQGRIVIAAENTPGVGAVRDHIALFSLLTNSGL
jgi:hypothetical protein